MHWISFSWGAFASLVLFVIVDAAQRSYQSELEKRGDPFDWINAKQFQGMICAADARYLILHRRYLRLKRTVEKLLLAVERVSAHPDAIAAATAEVDAALNEPEAHENEAKGPWPGQF